MEVEVDVDGVLQRFDFRLDRGDDGHGRGSDPCASDRRSATGCSSTGPSR